MNSYLYLSVEGKNLNRFLLKCNKNNINIIKIKYISYKSIIILINEKEYNKILKIKGINKIKIIKCHGKNRYISLIKKYNVLIISFIIGIFLLLFLSNMIFSVEVVGDNNKLNELISKELKNYGIERFKLKKDYDYLVKVKKEIKSKYKDNIEWIEIKNSGIKYIIKFVERKLDNEIEDIHKYSIVSKKDGIIRNIFVEKGSPLIEKGNYVKKGDILISSDIILNEEIKDKVNAYGNVFAETWYRVKTEFPINYKEKKYLNKKRKILYIKIGNNYHGLFKYKNYDRKKVLFLKNKLTNIEFGIEEIRKVEIVNKKYSTKEAIKKAKEVARDKIKLKLNEKEYIISEKTLNFYNNGSKIILDEFFSIYEEIGEKKEISLEEKEAEMGE